MREAYDTILERASDEFTEKRSRFIGTISPVSSEDDIQAFLAEQRALYADASHNCYAYILKDSARMRYSDDGEPHGTAGSPILEVIRREGIVDVMVVVTRYFGGTLLGAGGLIRAYSHTAKLALDAAKRVTMRNCTSFMLECPYHLYERARILLDTSGALILNTDFGSDVTFQARIRSDYMTTLAEEFSELSGGQTVIESIGEEFAPV